MADINLTKLQQRGVQLVCEVRDSCKAQIAELQASIDKWTAQRDALQAELDASEAEILTSTTELGGEVKHAPERMEDGSYKLVDKNK